MTAVILALLLWGVGEAIFLGIFFAIVTIVVLTLLASAWRTLRVVKEGRTDYIRWESEFHDLPASSRICRHEFTGEFEHRTCGNGFNCNGCATHAKLIAQKPEETIPASMQTTAGFAVPLDRMYHRGHTWVKPEEDGTYTIGVDDFASRLTGKPERVEVAKAGTHLHVNGEALTFFRGQHAMRFLAPIEGNVVETSQGENGWYLRLKPVTGKTKTGHLLRGGEVTAWIEREFARLQQLLADPAVGVTLPDGGMAVDDIQAAYPEKDWDAIYGTMFLEP